MAVGNLQKLSACRIQLCLFKTKETFGIYGPSEPVKYISKFINPMALRACKGHQYLYIIFIYLHTLWNITLRKPQFMYNNSTFLLPVWVVWSVQSISCRVELYHNSFNGPYDFNIISDLVEYSCISTPPMGRRA